MKFDWFRWHHGTCSDPKWRVVAARASHTMSRPVTVSNVLAVWACMTECASQATPRGTLAGWCDEDVAAGLDLEEAEVQAIYQAMQGKTLDGNRLMAWEKRQPAREREDPTATDRKRRQRERAGGVTGESHTASRQVTPREEEIREEPEVGSDEGGLSRARTHEGAPPHAPDSTPPTTAGLAAKALRAVGVTHVNPSHAKLIRLLEAGVTAEELADAGREAVAKRKGNLNYVCAMVESRRAEAADAGAVPGVAPAKAAAPASHRKYQPPPRETPAEAFAAERSMLALLLETGQIDAATHATRLDEARRRMEARAGPTAGTTSHAQPLSTH
jgi:hypothetical protein